MALIRYLSIRNFRGLATLDWAPRTGINALIGPGDTGKSTILDAIDLALGARRSAAISDADFFALDTAKAVRIEATIGALSSKLQNLDRFGPFLRGWDAASQTIEDEPDDHRLEPVLTIRMSVGADLEPHWTLYSERAEAEGLERDLAFADRSRLAPTRLGVFATHHMGWGARSILNQLAEERPSIALALSEAARNARTDFGAAAEPHLETPLKVVREAAKDLGVRRGVDARALLDVHEVAFGSGAVSLHDRDGIPLRAMGTGSSRLLAAGLQVRAAKDTQVAMIDELEHGLEPYRIVRLLHALGSKAETASRQIFLTSHSPTVICELQKDQIWLLRNEGGRAEPRSLAGVPQGVIRACSDAFLAPRVVICEGPTEMGLLRGLDLYFVASGKPSLAELGVGLADGGGSNRLKRALGFAALGYSTALLQDADVALAATDRAKLKNAEVSVHEWSPELATEEQLSAALPLDQLPRLLKLALQFFPDNGVADHLTTASGGALSLDACLDNPPTEALRQPLGKAAKAGGWFKRIEPAELIGHRILGPHFARTDKDLVAPLRDLWGWAGAPKQFDP